MIITWNSTSAQHLVRLLRTAARAASWAILIGALDVWSVGCHRRPAPPVSFSAFVVNNQSATLAVVNLASFRVTDSLPTAPRPERVLVRPGGHELYVVSAVGKITVVNYPQPRVTATIDVGRSARDLAFSADGRTAYIIDPADRDVVLLDCVAGKAAYRVPLRGTPSGLVLTPDGKTLVVAIASLNQLVFLDAQTGKLLGTVEVGHEPGRMVVLPDSSKVLVVDAGEEKISAADIAGRKLLSHIEIGTRPTGMLLKPDGGEVFVLSSQSSSMVILDAFHDNVEQTFPIGRDPVTGVFRRDSSILFIANAGDGSVTALDVDNRAVLTSTHVGMEPRALALTPDPDERFLVVADSAASSLAVLHADPLSLSRADPLSLSGSRSMLITTVAVGSRPVDVVVPDLPGK